MPKIIGLVEMTWKNTKHAPATFMNFHWTNFQNEFLKNYKYIVIMENVTFTHMSVNSSKLTEQRDRKY